MVDMEAVLGEVKRTAYVGAGTFASASVGNFLDDFVPGGDVGVAAAQMLGGAGAAAVADDRLGGRNTRGLTFDAGEFAKHASYGIGGAGFAEAADNLTEGGSQGQLVEVRTRSNASQASEQSQTDNDRREISVDV